jgi:nucleobase:cation symporter-1, NCS1 family
MIADYWLLRRTELDVPDLYRLDGRYGRVNWVAMAALLAGVLPNVPGFLKHAHVTGWRGDVMEPPTFFDSIYVYAWFTGFFLSGLVYLVGMRLRSPRRLGGAAAAAP